MTSIEEMRDSILREFQNPSVIEAAKVVLLEAKNIIASNTYTSDYSAGTADGCECDSDDELAVMFSVESAMERAIRLLPEKYGWKSVFSTTVYSLCMHALTYTIPPERHLKHDWYPYEYYSVNISEPEAMEWLDNAMVWLEV